MPANENLDYINSTDYKTLEQKFKDIVQSIDDMYNKQRASRKIRYADVDIEAEREEGRLSPDEMYVPQHICDTNIRREQSAYVQYVTQSPRAVICEDTIDPAIDASLFEKDLTKKLRYDGWQLEMFANIDGFQANGYGIMEIVQDLNKTGEIAFEQVEYADFGFVSDTRDIQSVEMTGRSYYFTKTRLVGLCGDRDPDNPSNWNWEQVEKLCKSDSIQANVDNEEYNAQERSLYKCFKIMFRVGGVVHVGWIQPITCDDWLRAPRPLFIGRKKLSDSLLQNPQAAQQLPPGTDKETAKKLLAIQLIMQGQPVPTEDQYEVDYPYFMYPYLISENNTVQNLRGRVMLDQDMQEGVTSLISSACTQARRASGLYFSKDVQDPNDDVLQEKNVYLKQGSVINSKVTAFHVDAPDPSTFSAIQVLASFNQNETSQVNFAVQNRKDSRKTAEEIKTANQQNQILSTVQVVLFSLALKRMYSVGVDVIMSRVLSGLIKVKPDVLPFYSRKWIIKPSGDVDVIEKQQLVQTMTNTWPVVQNTAIGIDYLCDLLEMLFPVNAAKYITGLKQAQQQQQSQQAQQQQQFMGMVKQLADGVIQLSKHSEMFSEIGKIHALPVLQGVAHQIEQMEKGQKQ
jgi:hypothetical protein